jgi:molybdopterin-guanine dinucleotide biosynthesis protein A
MNRDMEESAVHSGPAYPEPLDAVVLAGTDDNPKRMILGQNKAFLEIAGKALVRHVVESLLASRSVGHIFVVGPKERLQAALSGISPRVALVQQKGKMLSNAWAAFHAAEAQQQNLGNPVDPERPVLALSCDLPLISCEAVDDFVNRCAAVDRHDGDGYALLCGVAEEASLKQYYADEENTGIIRPYVNFAEYRVRLANIYVGRPRKLTNNKFLGVGFEHRKTAKLKNVLLLAWDFLSQSGGWTAAWLSLRMQATLMAERRGSRFYEKLRKGNSAARTEEVCSRVLGGSVKIVVSPYGGLSLDADNEEDFNVLNQRFEEWKKVPPAES